MATASMPSPLSTSSSDRADRELIRRGRAASVDGSATAASRRVRRKGAHDVAPHTPQPRTATRVRDVTRPRRAAGKDRCRSSSEDHGFGRRRYPGPDRRPRRIGRTPFGIVEELLDALRQIVGVAGLEVDDRISRRDPVLGKIGDDRRNADAHVVHDLRARGDAHELGVLVGGHTNGGGAKTIQHVVAAQPPGPFDGVGDAEPAGPVLERGDRVAVAQ